MKNIDPIIQFDEIKEAVRMRMLSQRAKEIWLNRKPASQLAVVETWQQETKEAKLLLASGQHMPFMGLREIDRILQQVEKGFVLEPSELTETADFLRSFRLIRRFMEKNQFQAPLLARYTTDLPDLEEIETAIYQAVNGNRVNSEISRPLKKIRQQIRETEQQIEERLQKFIRHPDNRIKLQEAMVVKKDGHWTVPVKASYKNQIKGSLIETSGRGVTVFIEPESVARLSEKLSLLEAEETAEVYQILAELTGRVAETLAVIGYGREIITEYDVIFARGKYSREIEGQQVHINKEERIMLKNVRHPLLGDVAVPLNVSLGENFRGLIITGPNAGGKTVVLKTVALVTMMTMIGLEIPAAPETDIALFDEIFVDIGDQQDLGNALSTFSGHMQNIAHIVRQTKRYNLILLDEIGSGTEPNEGAALAIASMNAMYQQGGLVIATTHYGEIKEFAQAHPDFQTAAMAFDSETLQPKYRLLLGETGESNAFWIAQRMQLPTEVIKQAKAYLVHHDLPLLQQHFVQQKAVQKSVLPQFTKGDRVTYLETNATGLFYEAVEQQARILLEDGWQEVPLRRLKLVLSAQELYPQDYEVENLFTDFHEQKFQRDLARGSKKTHKELRQGRRQ